MEIFVDTSAILAFADPGDQRHPEALQFWTDAVARGEDLVTSNYVLLEAFFLLQRRLGMASR